MGFFEQIIYTYLPFFLRTLLHPSHSFLTELRTFMPRVCCCTNDCTADCDCACTRNPLKREIRLCVGDWQDERAGREPHVWIERAGVRMAKTVRRSGRRRARGSIVRVMAACVGRRCDGCDCAAVTLMVRVKMFGVENVA